MIKNSLIVVVLDRSGSMESIRDDTIGGFNAFLGEQRKVEGECRLTLAQFDTDYELVHHNKPLAEIPALTRETFVPRGGTALLDAIGRTLNTVETDILELEKQGAKPDKVYFLVITDGEENSSHEYSRDGDHGRPGVFKMIADRRNNSAWEFIFLAANQDAIQAGTSYGFAAGSSIDYSQGSTSQAYGVMSNTIGGSRATGGSISFTSQDRSISRGY
jgi:hypothetical protein